MHPCSFYSLLKEKCQALNGDNKIAGSKEEEEICSTKKWRRHPLLMFNLEKNCFRINRFKTLFIIMTSNNSVIVHMISRLYQDP